MSMSLENNLRVPGAQLGSVQRICDWQRPYDYPEEYDNLFLRAMKEVTAWHFGRNAKYESMLAAQGWSAGKIASIERTEEIPFIPADFFKRYEFSTIPKEEAFLHLTSSGTTGQKSQMFFDEWSIKSAQRMVDWIFADNKWIDTQTCNYLLFTYETSASSKLGTAYTDNFLCKYAPVGKVELALKLTGPGTHDFDAFGCVRALQDYEREGRPVRIFGFPAFFYFVLEHLKKTGAKKIKLHPESLVFLGGGWKGYANKSIAKKDLYSLAEDLLGIPNDRLRDGYGSVEHCIPYVECAAHQFHVPIWSKVVVRDVKTLAPLPHGKPGFLQFISPYITSAPAQSVLMGDYAVLHPADQCSCGLPTPWFEILGRAGLSANKSCAVAAAELLGRKAGA